MKIWQVLALVVCGLPGVARAEDPNLNRCRVQAEQCSQALIGGAYDKLAECTHPKVVAMMGGASKMVEKISVERAKMKTEGVDFLAAAAALPKELVEVGTELYALVPMNLTIKMAAAKYHLKSVFVAWSADRGKTWKFIDGANLDDQKIKVVLPNFPSARIKIPANEPPVKF